MPYDSTDREIMRFLQGDIPLESRPYWSLAERLELSEEEIVLRVRQLREKGLLRRMGAVLRHRQAGFAVNAMVAWKLENEEEADQAGKIMAGYKEISHCYIREVPPDFDYNVFSMIHVKNEKRLEEIIEEISLRTGIGKYIIIRSSRELKKESMQYF
jgi:DNA-binding Lrp family transcriptional regulator